MSSAHFLLALPRDRSAAPKIIREAAPQTCHGAAAWFWANEAMPVVALDGGSLVIGQCFSRERSGSAPHPHPRASSTTDHAQSLLQKRWGAYLAVLRDEHSGRWRVMSEPTGMLPVFRYSAQHHVYLSSEPALLEQASGRKLQVCWNGMRKHLMHPDTRQRATCLVGVDELLPGVLLDPCDPHGAEELLWKPADHFPSDPLPSFGQAREELRAAATDVLTAWHEAYGSAAVAVSGGVDSSFICGALAAGRHAFGCITLATAERSGDERYHARLLAEHVGRPLEALIYDPEALGPHGLASGGLPRPSRRSFVSAVDAMLTKGAASLGAAVVFDGNVGDNLFCYLHSAVPVADRLRARGPGSGAFSTLLDMCRVTGCDVSTMAKATWREIRRGNRPPSPRHDLRFLSIDADDGDVIEPLTPWLTDVEGPHKGKRDHIALILRGWHNIHGISSRAPRLSPLMSQPVLETCLKIPTWLWPEGGINRALARSAFAGELPAELSTRTAKPGPDSFIRQAFERNRTELYALLQDGLLASNGLLDFDQLDQAFAGHAASDWSDIRRVLDLAEAENWARSWHA